VIIAVSIGRDTPAELRARVALNDGERVAVLRALPPGIDELVVLSTCHRTELYATATGGEADALHALIALLPGLHPVDQPNVRTLRGGEAVHHLYRVAAGLDSLVVGERQIMGQVRGALLLAQREGAAGAALANVFGRALAVGKRVRLETSVGATGSTIGALTAAHLRDRLGDLQQRTAVVVGAGEAAHDAASALAAAGARITVASRSMVSARRLASVVSGTAHSLEEMPALFARADCGVLAVVGGTVVTSDHLPPRRAGTPLFLVDVSMPPSIDVRDRADVHVDTLDDLRAPIALADGHALVAAETMVREAAASFARWMQVRDDAKAIGRLHEHAETIVAAELSRFFSSMSMDEQDRERVAALGRRIAKKLMHGPTIAMRDGGPEVRSALRSAFGVDP
jgi:glutamyl-tRNA reductase